MNDLVLLENVSLRQKLYVENNISVLEKAGKLVTLSEAGWTTKENIALFYQVDVNTLDQIIYKHKDELKADAYKVLSKKEFQNLFCVSFKIPNRGLAIFPRRAVLRIGMLLRDSKIAKLVRSYLLNVEEQSQLPLLNKQALDKMAD